MTDIQHYNDKFNFGEIIQPLEKMYTELDGDQRDILYEMLCRVDRELLRKAVKFLLSTHSFKRFPLEKEIRDAIREVKNFENKHKAGDFDKLKENVDCPNCNRTGYIMFEKKYADIKETYTTARYCVCPIGEYLKNTVKWRKND